MNVERITELARRAAIHAALADPARLAIVDTLAGGDASPSELSSMVGMPSNLMAHHLRVLEAHGLITRRPSEGDRRRTYLQLAPGALDGVMVTTQSRTARRILFVCTANSARSHLAAALWRQASGVAAVSAGTHPAERIEAGAIAAATRHRVRLPRVHPRRIDDVREAGDLIITVCDLAHEELGDTAALHWSVRDPVRSGSDAAFDAAVRDLTRRVADLAPQVMSATASATTHPGREARR